MRFIFPTTGKVASSLTDNFNDENANTFSEMLPYVVYIVIFVRHEQSQGYSFINKTLKHH